MKFNEYTNQWFDAVAELSKHPLPKDLQEILDRTKLQPTKGGFKKTILLLQLIPILPPSLAEHAQAIVDLKFKDEFRFTYSKIRGNVSTVSEFCSLLRQALTYHAPIHPVRY